MMYDAIVVGCGGVGSFALRALAKQAGRHGGSGKFLGIERYGRIGHPHGSSHGHTRIYRRAYFENPSYVPWIEFSLNVFQDMQHEHGISIMQQCGTLLFAPSNGGGVDQLPPLCRASYESAELYGVHVEKIDEAAMRHRYPQYKHKYDTVGLLEPGGGFLRPELIMETAQQEAIDHGAEVMNASHVTSFQVIPGNAGSSSRVGIRVSRDNESEQLYFETRHLLLSMGGWCSQLVPSWSKVLTPTRQLQGWVDVSQAENPAVYGYQHLPTWVGISPDWHLPLFGLPCDTDDPERSHWMKVGTHGRQVPITDPTSNPVAISADETLESQQAVTHSFHRALWHSAQEHPNFAAIVPCTYTMTPDENYMIGTPSGLSKNVFCVAGLSGHGFKNTPALGQMMADHVLGDIDLVERWQLDFCAPSRFGV